METTIFQPQGYSVIDEIPPNTTLDYYQHFFVSADYEDLKWYWSIWGSVSGLAALCSAFTLYTITSSHLVKSNFNKLAIALIFPDFLFSAACAVDCIRNAILGHWAEGDTHCQFQAVYVVFGFMGSIWMNVVILHELNMFWQCLERFEQYEPPSTKRLVVTVMCVYMWAFGWALLVVWPEFPINANAPYNLACVPFPESALSTALIHFVWIPFLICFPILYCISLLVRISKGMEKHEELRLDLIRPFTRFFQHIVVALIVFWFPTAATLWMFQSHMNAFSAWFAGLISHLQALYVAIRFLYKKDVCDVLLSRHSCWKFILCNGNSESVQETGIATTETHTFASSDGSEVVHSKILQVEHTIQSRNKKIITTTTSKTTTTTKTELVSANGSNLAAHITDSSGALITNPQLVAEWNESTFCEVDNIRNSNNRVGLGMQSVRESISVPMSVNEQASSPASVSLHAPQPPQHSRLFHQSSSSQPLPDGAGIHLKNHRITLPPIAKAPHSKPARLLSHSEPHTSSNVPIAIVSNNTSINLP